jgi:hypothetical protein
LPRGNEREIVADLEPIRFYRTVARHWDFSDGTPALRESTILSERRGGTTSIRRAQQVYKLPSDDFALTRLAFMPGNNSVLYSYSLFDEGRNRLVTELQWTAGGTNTTLFADGGIALDPAIDTAGNFVYFNGGRGGSGDFEIYRISAAGNPGVTTVIERNVDVRYAEPALKQNGEELAYVEYRRGEKQGHIHIAPTRGGLRTYICPGRQPAWSPDNKRLAYVQTNEDGFDQIWIFNQETGGKSRLTSHSERYHHRFPIWTKEFDRIVFAADKHENDEGERHFDIFLKHVNSGAVERLTNDGSFDSYPTIDPIEGYIYFLSNRWADHEGDNSWAIWRIALPTD